MLKQLILAVSMTCWAIPGALASGMLEVNIGYSQVVGPVGDMATVVVGDDAIADASLGSGNTIILTGKAVGSTNLIVLDEVGRQLLATSVQVVPLDRRPRTKVRLIKGAAKEQAYMCGPEIGCTAIETQNDAPVVVMNGAGNAPATEAPRPAGQPSGDAVSLNQ